MYEDPKLILVGKANEVILGAISIGDDLDGSIIFDDLVYADDAISSFSKA
jgi:hypothetical protein